MAGVCTWPEKGPCDKQSAYKYSRIELVALAQRCGVKDIAKKNMPTLCAEIAAIVGSVGALRAKEEKKERKTYAQWCIEGTDPDCYDNPDEPCDEDPVTLEAPEPPVVRIRNGTKLICYNLGQLFTWLKKHGTDPTTGLPLTDAQLNRVTRLYREKYKEPHEPMLTQESIKGHVRAAGEERDVAAARALMAEEQLLADAEFARSLSEEPDRAPRAAAGPLLTEEDLLAILSARMAAEAAAARPRRGWGRLHYMGAGMWEEASGRVRFGAPPAAGPRGALVQFNRPSVGDTYEGEGLWWIPGLESYYESRSRPRMPDRVPVRHRMMDGTNFDEGHGLWWNLEGQQYFQFAAGR